MPENKKNSRLIEKLEKLYLLEKKAYIYTEFLSRIDGQQSREKVSLVIKDEIKHEQMVKSLIKMAKLTND